MGLKQILLFLGLIALAGGGGYAGALGLVGKGDGVESTSAEATNPSVFAAGQFSIPLFEDNRVVAVLLAQINIEARDFQQLQLLSRNKPQLRSTIIETFFAMEREGVIAPGSLDPAAVSARLKADLEMMMNDGEIGGVLIDRLLLQESGRANARQPSSQPQLNLRR